jgi:hypothetical protein
LFGESVNVAASTDTVAVAAPLDTVNVPVPEPVVTTTVAAVVELTDWDTTVTPVTPEIENVGEPGVPLDQEVPNPVSVSVMSPAWFAGIAEGETVKVGGTTLTVALPAPLEIVSVPVPEPVSTPIDAAIELLIT